MDMSRGALENLRELGNEYAAAGYPKRLSWAFKRAPGPTFLELQALGLVEPTLVNDHEFRLTEAGQQWVMHRTTS
jgi:hypothetical protein